MRTVALAAVLLVSYSTAAWAAETWGQVRTREAQDALGLINDATTAGGQIARSKAVAAQTAWIAYRDAVCEYVASAGGDGPAAQGKAMEDCLIVKTKAHIEELRQLRRP